MDILLRSRNTLIFLLLIGATALSWGMGHGMGFEELRLANATIVVVAFIKVFFVFQDFMELRHAPRTIGYLCSCWLIGTCLLLIVLYWAGSSGNVFPAIQGL